jgi:CheY-like chemotaxis protein/HPt (histidine-containing phosphotransfer) domain-containing protein
MNVAVAATGREAAVRAARGTFDLILMDIQMPAMDGIATADEIRRLKGHHTPPIVAMTAHAQAGEREQLLAAGMDDCVAKPFDAKALLETISRCMAATRPAPDEGIDNGSNPSSPFALSVPGINVALGIRRVGGSVRFYRSILRDFHVRYADSADRIETLLHRQETTAAAEEVHSLKGAAGSIAAVGLHESAERLETALRRGDSAAIHAHYDDFTRHLEETLTAIGIQLKKS